MGIKWYSVSRSATGKAKVNQLAYRRAIVEQGKVKPEDFPINNRAARRRKKSPKAKRGPQP